MFDWFLRSQKRNLYDGISNKTLYFSKKNIAIEQGPPAGLREVT